jgi:hypothetical protein
MNNLWRVMKTKEIGRILNKLAYTRIKIGLREHEGRAIFTTIFF